ncbi:c-type cytochrome [Sulfitobacter sp. 1A15299]|uniref:c-type cytochrome n=1 Tax=Sulfitobacter sp. 1A15299 TaxID=3368598 RepID=UPI0037470375
MFTRKWLLIGSLTLVGSAALGQDAAEPRTAAKLPDILEETGERAPEPVPFSSADNVSVPEPENFQYGIGQPATQEQIAAIDIDTMPDGRGFPKGSGTYAEGAEIYEYECSSCHGENLEGIAELGAPKLIGGRGSLASDKPVKTIESYWPYSSTLFDYVHRAMPLHAPGSLSADEVYAVSAYILGRAGITSDEPDAMLDAESMPKVVMPNADGFIADPRDGSPGK